MELNLKEIAIIIQEVESEISWINNHMMPESSAGIPINFGKQLIETASEKQGLVVALNALVDKISIEIPADMQDSLKIYIAE